MKFERIFFSLAIILAGCTNEEQLPQDTLQEDVPVAVSLSFVVSNANKQDKTRQGAAVVQEGSVREIQFQKIIPFAVEGEITVYDNPKFASYGGDEITYEKTNSLFFYVDKCSFLSGVNAFLVYGKAIPITGGDAVNGALEATLSGSLAPAAITFSPKQIYSSGAVSEEAAAIANYLTTIANTPGWSTTSNSRLQAYYQNFIGQGSEKTSLIAGSSKNIEKYVAHLKTLLEAEPESELRNSIIANINETYPNNYPASIGLPDGAAALRWEIPSGGSQYAFVPQSVTTTEAAINSLTRYVYPAELYYYVSSDICTSTIDNRQTYYEYASWGTSNSDANTVLSGFENDPGMVSPDTKAVAIRKPVQYAVARLDAKIKTSSSTLTDARGNVISVGSTSFPLTGIIIGGQRQVGFDFVPTDNDDSSMRFVYDSQVSTNAGSTPFYLSTTEQGPVRTLLLQSYDGEDVTFVLEFRNDSDADFYGVDGIIYKGTKFYLVGILKLDEATGDDKSRVFTQDQITTATMSIGGLAKAYNVMPNLLSPQLEIGVSLITPWTGSTPTTVILE